MDALAALRTVAGLPADAQCIGAANVVCADGINAVDALALLRYVASLPANTGAGCVPIGEGLTAEGLAGQLQAATETGAAEAALRLIYKHLGVGLYTADGQQILAGGETGPDDFYLYDFESALLARNYVERQLFGLDTATVFLAAAGVVDADSGQPLTDADVLSMLADGVTAARGDESPFTWRLIDELGLVREDPLDLAAPGLDPAATYLDSVQTFLVLYDMTLGLPAPAGASSEVLGAADAPDARTKALHDYSWVAQRYSVYAYPVAPTHWKHQKSSAAENRTLSVSRTYKPAGDDLVILAGPLAGFDLDEVLGTVKGRPVRWVTEPALVPKNGKWRETANSYLTVGSKEGGYADIEFVPKTECAPGKGPVKTDPPHKVYVKVYTLIASLFPPYGALGELVKVAKTEIGVSRHMGGASLGAAGAAPLAANGAMTDDEPPCAYEGTASATVVGNNDNSTDTASDLRFELQPPDSPPGGPLRYELVRGNLTWQESGTLVVGDVHCPNSGGSSIPEPISGDGVHIFSGYILVDVQKSEYLAYGTAEDREGHIVTTCPHLEPYGTSYYTSWLKTTDTSTVYDPDRSFTPGGALEGSFDFIAAGFSFHYQWSLHPVECQPSPQPVCQ